MDIPLILHVANYFVDASLSNILFNELGFGDIGEHFGALSIRRSEAEAAIRDAVLILDLLWAHRALERQNARDQHGLVFEGVLILVEAQDEVGIEVDDAAIEE